MKKLLAIVISMAMVLAMLPMGVYGAGFDTVDSNRVASITSNGTTVYYDSLQAAIDAATNGQEVKLLKDTNLNSMLILEDKEVAIDLNGKKISNEEFSGDDDAIVSVCNKAKLTINDSSKDKTGEIIGNNNGARCAIKLGKATENNREDLSYKLVINGGTLTGDYYAIVGNGTRHGTEITINGGKLVAKYTAVYHPQDGTLTINGGEIEGGGTGIEIRSGELYVKGGKITGKGKPTTIEPNGNGTTSTGVGIAIAQHNTKKAINVSIEKGEINGFSALYQRNIQNNSQDDIDKIKISISGGTFNSINDGTVAVYSENIKSFIKGGTFSDLSALDYLGDNADINIALSKDTSITAFKRIEAGRTVTIDLNGNKIERTRDIGTTVFDIYGSLTIKDSSSDAKGVITCNNENATPVIVEKNGTLRLLKGTIEGTYAGVYVMGDCTSDQSEGSSTSLTIEDGAIKGTSSNGSYGIVVLGKGSTINIEGGVVEAVNGYAISGNGFVNDKNNYGNTVINISAGKVVSDKNYAIYHPQKGTLNITGGEVNGLGGIEVKSGEAKVGISGNPIIKATAQETSHKKSNNGTSTSGYAIALVANKAYAGDASVQISGGNIYGSVISLNDDNEQNVFPLSITGGTFSTDPSDYVTSGYYAVNNDGTYTVYRYVPSNPTDNVTNNTTDKNTTADLNPTVSDNKATTTVDADTAAKIVDKAVANKSTEVIVDATGNNTVASSEVGIPEATVKELSEKTDANLVIKTDNGKVDLDKTALDAVAAQAGTTGTVKLVVETVKTDENICHVDLKLVTSNGNVTDFKGGNVKVTVSLDKELAGKELVCVYINDNGIYTKVDGVLNADGTYTFTTGHFSEYAVMPKTDADKTIAEQLDTLIKEVNLKATTVKTAKKNVKVTVNGDVTALKDAGYTVKYKFYRSTKKASKYTAKVTKDTNTYINTTGKKGTKYYYKARVLVYDGDTLVGQTELKQCRYGARIWTK